MREDEKLHWKEEEEKRSQRHSRELCLKSWTSGVAAFTRRECSSFLFIFLLLWSSINLCVIFDALPESVYLENSASARHFYNRSRFGREDFLTNTLVCAEEDQSLERDRMWELGDKVEEVNGESQKSATVNQRTNVYVAQQRWVSHQVGFISVLYIQLNGCMKYK